MYFNTRYPIFIYIPHRYQSSSIKFNRAEWLKVTKVKTNRKLKIRTLFGFSHSCKILNTIAFSIKTICDFEEMFLTLQICTTCTSFQIFKRIKKNLYFLLWFHFYLLWIDLIKILHSSWINNTDSFHVICIFF